MVENIQAQKRGLIKREKKNKKIHVSQRYEIPLERISVVCGICMKGARGRESIQSLLSI
jgi:hypothetical protein